MSHIGTTQTDYELTQSIGRGVVSGIGVLYQRHRPLVYSICLRMTGNASAAEDLTQEIFIQLLGKAGSFRGESRFELAISIHDESCADALSQAHTEERGFLILRMYLPEHWDRRSLLDRSFWIGSRSTPPSPGCLRGVVQFF